VAKLTAEESEIIGALIGDGYIHRKDKRSYCIGFTGSPQNDVEYYEYILGLIKKVWKKDAKAKVRARGLRVAIHSKEIVTRLIDYFNMPYGENKSFKVKIPKQMLQSWTLTKATLRGIIDTDGTVFVANKPGSPNYPSIEIATSSIMLAKQIRSVLISHEFRVSNIWSYKSKNSTLTTHRLALNGRENLKRWLSEIGFSNPYKYQRAVNALRGCSSAWESTSANTC